MVAWLALVCVLPAAGAAKYFDHRTLAETAKTKFIIPGYQQFGASLADLRTSLSKLCATPGEPTLMSARNAYRKTIAAWGTIEIINFGPVTQDNRFDRIFYWPDRKGYGRRQVLRLLKKRDPNILSAAKLAQKSIAVQGLTALEIVLSGKTSEPLISASDQGYSCRYARAIVENLVSINEAVLQEWTSAAGFAKLWLNPGHENPVYLSGTETTLELVNALDLGIENVRDKRIAPILGVGSNRRKFRPILWRSKSSMVLIHANIAALHNLLFQAGLSDAFVASEPNETMAAKYYMAKVQKEFDMLLEIATELLSHADPFPGREVEVEIANRLLAVGFHLKEIRFNNVPEIKKAAGLVVGFNASDGD
ncbi:MAG: imelysin family protein [Pseudomonadota bacterium]